MAFNLFAAAADQAKSDALVEFKAGRMVMQGKMVSPDKRKGSVVLRQSEDGLMHFIWKERPSGRIETDLIIFPDDAAFRKVKEANARVYLLEFKTSSKKEFFWMQDLSDEKDEQHCNDINKYISDPPTPGSGNGGGLGDLSNLNQEQLMWLRALQQAAQGGGAGGRSGRPQQQQQRPAPASGNTSAATPAARPAPASNTSAAPRPAVNPNLGDQLRGILSNLPAVAAQQERVQLTDVCNGDEIVKSGLFEHEDVVKKLAEFLPEGPVTAENMKDNVRSPQFQQAVALFNAALRSGDLAGIMASFGLDPSSVGPNGTIEDFLLAIQKQAKQPPTEDEKK